MGARPSDVANVSIVGTLHASQTLAGAAVDGHEARKVDPPQPG